MKIFLSWSGDYSRQIANVLSVWLRKTIQAVEPFYTPDMEKGVKWSNEIDAALEGTRFGIVCLTPDNLNSTWIHFETGALSKTLDASIWTFLVGLKQGDVPQPLGKFQHTILQKEDVFKLVKSINNKVRELGPGFLTDSLLSEIFDENWPKLEESINKIKIPKGTTDSIKKEEKVRPEEDILNEILEVVRTQQRQINSIDTRVQSLTLEKYKKEFKNVQLSLPSEPTFVADRVEFSFDLIIEPNREASKDGEDLMSVIHLLRMNGYDVSPISNSRGSYLNITFSINQKLSVSKLYDISNLLSENFGSRFQHFEYNVVHLKSPR